MNIITPFGCLTNSCLVDFLKHRYHLFLLCADQTANDCSEHGTQSFRFTFHALFNKELNYVIFGLTPFIRCRYSLFHRHCLPEKHRGSKRCHWTVAGREQLKRRRKIRFQQLQRMRVFNVIRPLWRGRAAEALPNNPLDSPPLKAQSCF